jgi:GT2 family glycosyltransferase
MTSLEESVVDGLRTRPSMSATVSEKISIVVLNHNGMRYVERCLESVLETDYPNLEVILVDSCSTDGSPEAVGERFGHDPKLRIVRSPENLWYARGNNMGARLATGKYLVFLNEDTLVQRQWLKELVRPLELDNTIGVTSPKLLLMEESDRIDCIGSYFTSYGFLFHEGHLQLDSYEYSFQRETFSVKGACFVIRRDLFENLGGFDEDFVIFFEESDLCWRIWLAGHRVVFVPTAHVLHRGARDRATSRRALYMGTYIGFRNRLWSLFSNLEMRNLVIVMPVHTTLCIGLSLSLLSKGLWLQTIYILKALLTLNRDWPYIVKRRAHVQRRIRKVRDNDFLPRLTKRVGLSYFLWLLSNHTSTALQWRDRSRIASSMTSKKVEGYSSILDPSAR